ncbi:MAG: BPSL0067 family protein [Ferrovibrio sp.]|uniref:BPSL0067 family protein n=1 Tax=Ferrovibrio sp. TaxID=1917215 RepID=UPI00260FC12F|nr:BPSL0067 family protein [Ferrovibrio sp.]MCW0236137.1 BPSL0067 family protein [Ferrovibrio sp.]
MTAYQRLFGPPSQDDLEYLPDPMGRLDMGAYVEKPEASPDPGWEAARNDWMSGAPLGRIFGDGLFDLQDGVGAEQANRRGDVFKLQALLHREGFLDSAATDGPTGFWGGRDHEALRNFQKENGLSVDGFAAPGGETIETIRGFYKPQAPLGISTREKRGTDPVPSMMPPLGRGDDRPAQLMPRSSEAGHGDVAEASGMMPMETQRTSALIDTSSQIPIKPSVESAPPMPATKPAAPGQGWVLDTKGQQAVRDVELANKALPDDKKKYLYPDSVKDPKDQQECVVLVQKALPSVGNSKTWKEGDKLKSEGDPPLQPGTAIATFKDGKYPGWGTGNHAAIFQRYGERDGQKGIYVLDQSRGKPPAERFIRFDDKVNSMSRNAGAFSVIQRPGK